ncbi:host attachment protein [Salinisphaera hydrothermalis]|uniref:host attachment protein n=1 Tax=Salinisphaera hydrothermalis TaxID=563188 RepID=UPI00333FADC8
MRTIWVVAADRARARIFECRGASGIAREITDLVHPQSRRAAHVAGSDAPGRSYDRFGGGRHAMAPRRNKTVGDISVFADEIASYLARACQQRRFDRLYLLVEPRVLGALRQALDMPTRRRIVAQYPLDVAGMPAAAIRAHLPQYL